MSQAIDTFAALSLSGFTPGIVDDDLPGTEFAVAVLRADELSEHLPAWQRLVEKALEPNVFYEPNLLLPATKHLAGESRLEFVVVHARSRKYPDQPVWCGLFPLECLRQGPARFAYRQLWKYAHCYLCTPLVRADVAAQALGAFFDWLAGDKRGRTLLKLDGISADGPFHQRLVEACHRRELRCWVAGRHLRALFRPASDSETYLLNSMARKRRHEMRRLGKRLAEQGHVEYHALGQSDQLDAWIDDFLDLESRGWKGENGTALGVTEHDRAFFSEMAYRAHASGRLLMTSLRVNRQVIAQNCGLTSADGGFAFKIAFDESFARFSPGVLLEAQYIEVLHELGLAWMDSCAAPDHPMINHLWKDRRTIESLWIAGPAFGAQLALSLMPLAKLCRNGLSRRRRAEQTG